MDKKYINMKKKYSKKHLFLTDTCDVGVKLGNKNLTELSKMTIDKDGELLVKGIPASILDIRNSNGRTYASNDMKKSIKKLDEDKSFELRRLLSTAYGHPDSGSGEVPPTKASHVVVGARIEEIEDSIVLLNDWVILNTTEGKNLKALLESDITIGTSIRGFGDDESGKIVNYEFCGCDCVSIPAAGTFFKVKNESINLNLPDDRLVDIESLGNAISENIKLDIVRKERVKKESDNSARDVNSIEDFIHKIESLDESEVDPSALLDDIAYLESKYLVMSKGDIKILSDAKELIKDSFKLDSKEESNK